MHKGYLRVTAFLGALSVTLGAFAAHYLRSILTDKDIMVFETGVRYQLYHSLALGLVAVLYKEFPNKFMQWAGILFIAGIVLFSGSLYLLTYKNANALQGWQWVGPVTPLGGVLFIAGWLYLALGIKNKYEK
ncbi:MAG: DUF423 domain-containing protein [Chitinophaga sp.]|jgi:uncharacterized membrane protein YgdD (TMEM256/DUF423 family)|nr:DUF423 domain-containing protein [Chitinophaga sp.]